MSKWRDQLDVVSHTSDLGNSFQCQADRTTMTRMMSELRPASSFIPGRSSAGGGGGVAGRIGRKLALRLGQRAGGMPSSGRRRCSRARFHGQGSRRERASLPEAFSRSPFFTQPTGWLVAVASFEPPPPRYRSSSFKLIVVTLKSVRRPSIASSAFRESRRSMKLTKLTECESFHLRISIADKGVAREMHGSRR